MTKTYTIEVDELRRACYKVEAETKREAMDKFLQGEHLFSHFDGDGTYDVDTAHVISEEETEEIIG